MNYRETAVALALVASVSGCTGESAPTAAPRQAQEQNEYVFLPTAGDSDYFQAVNCDEGPDASMAGVNLVNPLDDTISLTLGESDVDPARLHDQSTRFLGGVTIYAVGNDIYKVASSESNEVQEFNLRNKNYSDIIEIDEDTSVVVSAYVDQKGYYFASIRCEGPALQPESSPTDRV